MAVFEGWIFIEDVDNNNRIQKVRHYIRGPEHISACHRVQAADLEGNIEYVPEDDKENCRICRNIRRHERYKRGRENNRHR